MHISSISKKWIVGISVLVALFIVWIVFLMPPFIEYMKISRLIEEGVAIKSFSDQDKEIVGEFFDFSYDDTVMFSKLQYESGFRDSCIEFYAEVSTKDNETIKGELLANYERDNSTSVINGLDSLIVDGYPCVGSYTHKNNLNYSVFVFEGENKKIYVYYSYRTGTEISDYVKQQVKQGNYEKPTRTSSSSSVTN